MSTTLLLLVSSSYAATCMKTQQEEGTWKNTIIFSMSFNEV